MKSNKAEKKRLARLIDDGFDRSAIVSQVGLMVRCSQCQALVINNVACHEKGCPNTVYHCRECGEPVANRHQRTCTKCAWEGKD